MKLKLFRHGNKDDVLTLRKQIKKEIHRAASRYGKNKLNYLKQSKPQQWCKKSKEIGVARARTLISLLGEPPEQTANELNKHLASIVQAITPLSENHLILETPKDKIPEISAKQIIRKNTESEKKLVFFPLIS